MSVQLISPVRELLDQWLLLPLFADLGMIVLVLRAVRNRAGYTLTALLALFAVRNLATIWPDAPGAPQLDVVCASMLPAMVALFVLSYAGGRRFSGARGWRALLLLVPAAFFAAWAVQAGLSAGDRAVPLYALVFFGFNICLLLLSGAARSFTGEEPVLFAAAITMIIVSGPVFALLLPALGLELAIFPYTSAGAGALFAMATLRYKAFSAAPAARQTRAGGTPLPPGLFIAGTGEGRRARALFLGAVRFGAPGVMVTRTHPAAVRRETGLLATPVIWLANSAYEKSLPPSDVEVLSHTLRDLGEQCAGCVVLIEDLDYLVTNAGHYQTLDMLGEVRRQAERASMTVLLSSGLLTDEERRDLRDIGVRPMPRDAGAPARA